MLSLPALRRPDALVTAALLSFSASIPANAQWMTYPTAGVPRKADGKVDMAARTPRLADGKPDFSGVWMTGESNTRRSGELSSPTQEQGPRVQQNPANDLPGDP